MSLKKINYNNLADKELYNKLFYKEKYDDLSDDEKDFVKTMYHMEEYACGLDG